MKKGFTLLELLAVIIILAIVALITTPVVLNVVDEAKKSAFQDSTYGLIKSGEYYYTSQILNGGMSEDKVFHFPNNTELEFSGTGPESGYIKVTKEGLVEIAISDGKYCATKGLNDTEVTVTDDLNNCVGDLLTMLAWEPKDVDDNLMVQVEEYNLVKISNLTPEKVENSKLTIINNEEETSNTIILSAQKENIVKYDKIIIIVNYFLIVLEDNYTLEGITFEESGIYVHEDICNLVDYTFILDWSNGNYLPPFISVDEVTINSIKINVLEETEYSLDGVNWQDEPLFTGLNPATEYTIYSRYKNSENTAIGTLKVSTDKNPGPIAPSVNLLGITDKKISSVTVNHIEGAEYSLDGVNWQDSCIFDNKTGYVYGDGFASGIISGTDYTYYVRYKETDTHYASEYVTGTFTSLYTIELSKDNLFSIGYDDTVTDLIIPATIIIDEQLYYIQGIANETFKGQTNLISVKFDENSQLTYIGSEVFYNCLNLTSVVLPHSLKRIDDSAFYNCTSLINVTIYDGLLSIGGDAFGNCTNLVSINIPDSVTNLVSNAFYGCESLTSIVLPESTTYLPYYLFQSCTNLKTVTIGRNVKRIAPEVFYGCAKIDTIYFEGTVEEWNKIELNENWNADIIATEVICIDGVATLS